MCFFLGYLRSSNVWTKIANGLFFLISTRDASITWKRRGHSPELLPGTVPLAISFQPAAPQWGTVASGLQTPRQALPCLPNNSLAIGRSKAAATACSSSCVRAKRNEADPGLAKMYEQIHLCICKAEWYHELSLEDCELLYSGWR